MGETCGGRANGSRCCRRHSTIVRPRAWLISPAPGGLRRSLTIMRTANPLIIAIATAIIVRQLGFEAPAAWHGDEEKQEYETIEVCRISDGEHRKEILLCLGQ